MEAGASIGGRGGGDAVSWERILGPLLLILALGFQAVWLAPELEIERYPTNDHLLHHFLSVRLVEAAGQDGNVLDPWVGELAFGYPFWRTYHPLSHGATALAMAAGGPLADSWTVYAFLVWLLGCLVPAAFYAGARLLGLRSPEAGLAALLALLPSASGHFYGYGLGYDAFVWRGTGLYAQLWAFLLFPLALGACARALRDGRGRTRAGVAVGLTFLAHVAWGYAAGLSAVVLALGLPGTREEERLALRLRRRAGHLAWIAGSALSMTLFVIVPGILHRPWTNHSRWAGAWKWDSFGASEISKALARGDLFDAGRPPVLTLLVAVGCVALLVKPPPRAGRVPAILAILWLLVFFGRPTWGEWLHLLLIPGDLHLHRFQGVFQACAVLAAAAGAGIVLRAAGRLRPAWGGPAASLLLLALLLPLLWERGLYLRENAEMGRRHVEAWRAEEADLEAVAHDLREAMARRPGRAYAGISVGWGAEFRVGASPFYHLFAREGLPNASFGGHSMAAPVDVLPLADPARPAHLVQFGVRYVVVPADAPPLPGTSLLARHGRFALSELDRRDAGYLAPARVGPRCPSLFPCTQVWVETALPEAGVLPELPPSDRGDPGPLDGAVEPGALRDLPVLPPLAGAVDVAPTEPGRYAGEVSLESPGAVVLRTTYDPGWRAFAGEELGELETLRVVPGFLAVELPAGETRLMIEWFPSPWKLPLLALGLLAVGGLALAEKKVCPRTDPSGDGDGSTGREE